MRALDFALNQILPEDVREDSYSLDKKGLSALLLQVARRHPEKYADITQAIGDLGRNAAWFSGFSTTADDTRPVLDRQVYLDQMDAELDKLRKRRDTMSDKEFAQERDRIMVEYADLLEKETMQAAMKSDNAFAQAVASGARGNPAHIRAIVTTPALFADATDKVIPLFVRSSYSEGVRPGETLAGTYGGRKAVISTKTSTAKGGDLGKITGQSTSKYNVTERDCGVRNGMDFEPDDRSLIGRVLARPLGDFDAGTVIDRKVAGKLSKQSKPVIARSVMTCQAKHGICAKCAGLDASGHFPKIGDSYGITAGQALFEPVIQGALNCLAEGTLVRMADYTLREIQDIRPGDMVMGADISGKTFPVRVTHLWDQGLQPVQRYVYRMAPTKQEISVVCTEDHPILQITEYSNAKEEAFNHTPRKLPAGRKAGRPAAALPGDHTPTDGLKSEPLAVVLGLLLGDGIRIQHFQSCVMLSCAQHDVAEATAAVLRDHGMRMSKCQRSHDWSIVTDATGRSSLRLAMDRLRLTGKYAHEKSIPEEVWTWDQDSVASLIAGFISADGSVYRNKDMAPGVSFGSTSRVMLEGIKDLLRVRFGIYSSAITRTGRAGEGNRAHDMWQFTVTRRDQVIRLAGIAADRTLGNKGSKLMDYIAEAPPSHFDHLPHYKAKRVRIEDEGVQHCWDIAVDHPDSLFVLHNSLIVKNTKHTGGAASGKKTFAGLDVITQFVQAPTEFKDRAAVAENDGMVESIEPAPQGGTYITIGGEKHFALPGMEIGVKVGDNVEAGDILSDGLANPSDIVRLRGMGEGRRYYMERFGQILKDSGQNPEPRNLEMLAKAAIDTYVMEDPDEDDPWLPYDRVRESDLLQHYRPPKDAKAMAPRELVGNYLQQPVLHYTVGTRITPKMADRMTRAGVETALGSRTAPGFISDMQRLRTASHDSRDWMESLGTSYLKTQLRDSVERGDDTNVKHNYHYGPRLAYGVGFGENARETGEF